MNLKLENDPTKILIVEDEAILAESLEEQLTDSGHDVVGVVDSGAKAIIKAAGTKPDIILMDIKLKGEMTGIEASKLIQQKLAVAVIYLTANSDQSTIERVKETDPYGFLTKPVNKRELDIIIQLSVERQKFEREQRRIQNERREELAMYQAGILASSLAHDISSPLMKIKSGIEKLKVEQSEKENIGKAVLKSLELIKDFKNNLNEEAPETVPVNLNAAISEAIELHRDYIELGGVEVLNSIPEDKNALANSTHLLQVFSNLIRNAIEALEGVSEKKIVAKVESESDSKIILSLADSGPRPKNSVIEKMFRPQFSTKKMKGGTGMGLAICRRLLQLHGASIELDRAMPQTVFLLTFQVPASEQSFGIRSAG